jgi:hypothetical protein
MPIIRSSTRNPERRQELRLNANLVAAMITLSRAVRADCAQRALLGRGPKRLGRKNEGMM